ncbi:MAG: hypothetical protein F4X87_05445 [Chloroflexi bacterium]|nr:hypothetical protein [Chloroflexota bacterium]
MVEAQEGNRGRGDRPGRCGAAHHRGRRAGLPEPRRSRHRLDSAQAVPRAPRGAQVPPLTAGFRASHYPFQHAQGSPPSGAALLLCPQDGCRSKATQSRCT